MIDNVNFKKLKFPEIVAISSIFLNEIKIEDNLMFISDLNCSNICKDIIKDLNNIKEEYQKKRAY